MGATHVIVRLEDGTILETVGDKAVTVWENIDQAVFFQLRKPDTNG